jgi:hypothetical protein
MTVGQLIEELQRHVAKYGPDTPVHHSYNYGDHWRTTVAPGVGQVTEERIVESDYHNMPKVLDEEDNRYYDETKHTTVVVLC